jgi:nucleoside-diphosphate-sugar epimerase
MTTAVIGAHGFVGRAVMGRLPDAVAIGRGDAVPQVDTVVHLAKVTPEQAVDHFRQSQARRFVFVSTAKVYGETGTFAVDDPPNPQSAYAREKLATERALAEAAGDRLVIVRPPLVVGPGARGNVAMLRWCIRHGIPLPLAGANRRRSMVRLNSLADFLARCCEDPAPAPISAPADLELTSAELARRIAHLHGRRARLFAMPAWAFPASVRRRFFDSFRIAHHGPSA